MGKFENALKFTLQWEGGYVNHPADPGGATNMGITQGAYDAYRRSIKLNPQPVRGITRAEVDTIYRKRYWDAINGDTLGEMLGIALFDVAVNMGVGRAREFMRKVKSMLDDDPSNDDLEMARRVTDLRVSFYYSLARRRPTMRVFLKGWLNRARALKKAIGY
jgi:lysozyme family protein